MGEKRSLEFSRTPANSCHIVSVLENMLINRSLLLPCTIYDDDNSKVFNSIQFNFNSIPLRLNSTTELISHKETIPYFGLNPFIVTDTGLEVTLLLRRAHSAV